MALSVENAQRVRGGAGPWQTLNEIVAGFSGVLCHQLEAFIFQAGSSSQEIGSSQDGGGDEEDEDGDGDAQDVRQQLLLQVFSCRKLTLHTKPTQQICFTSGVFGPHLKLT